ncbi:MAG: hypothetical protein DWQ05_19285 [Calditrichaeota bacterium]|nr:MAG: hypothetical protein DWQ05_19285 [Calditrichota bacterium]
MALRIQNNSASLSANRNLSKTSNRLALSLERFSSGYRINRAADDTAGPSISHKFRAQILMNWLTQLAPTHGRLLLDRRARWPF